MIDLSRMFLLLLVSNQSGDDVGIFKDSGRVRVRIISSVPEVLFGSQFLNLSCEICGSFA